jgi:hypothetical protein
VQPRLALYVQCLGRTEVGDLAGLGAELARNFGDVWLCKKQVSNQQSMESDGCYV